MKGLKFTRVLAVVLTLAFVAGASMAFAAEKPITLKYAIWTNSPTTNVFSKANTWLVREWAKESKGRIKVQYYYSGTLLPAKKAVAGLKAGIADLANIMPEYSPGALPLLTVGSLAAISQDYWPSACAVRDLMKDPAIKAEMGSQNLVYGGNVENVTFGYWTKKPVKSFADLKGKKIVATGPTGTLVEALGSIAIPVISTEVYEAMDKGTADGGLANPGYATDYRWQEICHYYFDARLGNKGSMFMAFNKDSWNKIPKDLQNLLIRLQDKAFIEGHKIYQGNAENQLKKLVETKQVTVSEPSKADRQFLVETARKAIWSGWVKKMNDRGLPGQRILDLWRSLYEKYAAQSPFNK